jgi:hypothetical protein
MRGTFNGNRAVDNQGGQSRSEALQDVGTFQVVVKYTIDKYTKKNNDPMVSVLFEVVSGVHQGKVIWDNLIFAKEGSPAEVMLFKPKHFLESIGEQFDGDNVFYDTDNWKNKTLTIEVQLAKEKDKDGKDKYEVVYIKQQTHSLEDMPNF